MRWRPRSRVTREELEQAESRLDDAKKLAERSKAVSDRLSHEIALNGWTKKFQIALGRRA